MGIPKIYEYFCSLHPEEVSEEVTSKLRQPNSDAGAIIAEYAKSGQCALCQKTIKQFVKSYGAEAGKTYFIS